MIVSNHLKRQVRNLNSSVEIIVDNLVDKYHKYTIRGILWQIECSRGNNVIQIISISYIICACKYNGLSFCESSYKPYEKNMADYVVIIKIFSYKIMLPFSPLKLSCFPQAAQQPHQVT